MFAWTLTPADHHGHRRGRSVTSSLLAFALLLTGTFSWTSAEEAPPYPGYVEGSTNLSFEGTYAWEESIITSYILGLKGRANLTRAFYSGWSSLWSDPTAWNLFLYNFYTRYLDGRRFFTRDLKFEGMS